MLLVTLGASLLQQEEECIELVIIDITVIKGKDYLEQDKELKKKY